MTEIVAFDDIKDTRRIRREMPDGHLYNTPFIDHSKERMGAPNVFMIESSEHRVLDTHFHDVDQFQIIVGGGGKLGRHKLAPYSVHFARAFTPYGPLVSGPGPGVAYVTLRARACPVGGAQRLPAHREKLQKMTGRQPWQVTGVPEFVAPGTDGVGMRPIDGLKDDKGLAGYSLSMKPGAKTRSPDPAAGDGQYVVVLKGSLIHQGVEKKGITVIHLNPSDGAFPIVAGPEGLQGLVLNFPLPTQQVKSEARPDPAASRDKLWQCELCAFSYDEAAGLPEEGIAPGTPWEQVPHDFICPDCSATKAEFVPLDL